MQMFSWLNFRRQSFVISLSSAMAALLLFIMLALVLFVLRNSTSYFWPADIFSVEYVDDRGHFQKEFAKRVQVAGPAQWVSQPHFNELNEIFIASAQTRNVQLIPSVAEVLLNDGNILYLNPDKGIATDSQSYIPSLLQETQVLQAHIASFRSQVLTPLHIQIAEIERGNRDADNPKKLALEADFAAKVDELNHSIKQLESYRIAFSYADGTSIQLPLSQVARIVFPNQMNGWSKFVEAAYRFWIFVTDDPKKANRAGGVFPALFGTVLMVLLMSVIVTPLGILAAIYLHEYAPQNLFTSLVRTTVNNLAGIPSVVFGVFGLGFLVYTLGGSIDNLFFSEKLPNPTFGSPGIFWAAFTMALLTLPVVIVSTEEGLRRVPKSLRQGSYALGATQAETIRHTVLPIASPGIMTGVILAVARAAGEVAPLILVGAVKFAPSLPVDGTFPFLHLDRQFMHLGVMIYDGAFHGQQGSLGSDFMFATCLLLLLIVFTLHLIATFIRSRLRRRYAL